LIAVGTSPAAVKILGAEQNTCLQPETLTKLTELPRRLVVLGTGASACQWAQAFRHFGSQVHLVGREATIPAGEDPDAAGQIQARLEQDDIRLHLDCEELAIETTGNLRGVVIGRDGQKEKLLVDQVLLCRPREPNAAGLGLETAAVLYTDRGVIVNDRLQTSNRHIFAAGEVCGPEFATPQAAQATARLAVHNALSLSSRKIDRWVIPRCIYTDPQLAQVGLTRIQAAEHQIEIDTYRIELSEADSSIPPRRREGFIAVHVRRRTGRIVGATVVAEDADELIAPLVLLMTRKLPLTALADVIPCRPSRLELLTRLAERCVETRPSSWARWMEMWRVSSPADP
jgi:pyruvate/2-oxoglutarate dehydrogenase complex dihydrolipoamide dehydrogenase (E3) component